MNLICKESIFLKSSKKVFEYLASSRGKFRALRSITGHFPGKNTFKEGSITKKFCENFFWGGHTAHQQNPEICMNFICGEGIFCTKR